MRGQPGNKTPLEAQLSPGFLGMHDFISERSFDSRATCVIDVLGLFLTCYPWVFVQPATGMRPVDWCRY